MSKYFAETLSLQEPLLPWHTERTRVAELGAALGIAAGAAGKVALDVELLAQSEVGEVREAAGEGRGRSSTMPHKRNPVGSVAVRAGVARAQALVPVLLASMAQEHERSAGAWQAEWGSLSQLFELTAGVFARTRALLEGLEVDEGRMERNLTAGGGSIMAEALLAALSSRMPGGEARLVMDRVAARSHESGAPMRECVMAEAAVTSRLTEMEIDQALDPRNYLGAADAFVDRVLEAYRSQVKAAAAGRGAG